MKRPLQWAALVLFFATFNSHAQHLPKTLGLSKAVNSYNYGRDQYLQYNNTLRATTLDEASVRDIARKLREAIAEIAKSDDQYYFEYNYSDYLMNMVGEEEIYTRVATALNAILAKDYPSQPQINVFGKTLEFEIAMHATPNDFQNVGLAWSDGVHNFCFPCAVGINQYRWGIGNKTTLIGFAEDP